MLEAEAPEAVAAAGATSTGGAPVAGVGMFAAGMVVAVVDGRHSLIEASKSDWDRLVQQKALVPAPWHCIQTGEFFDGKKARPEPIRLEIRNDCPFIFVITGIQTNREY
jgi:hypothetical protein